MDSISDMNPEKYTCSGRRGHGELTFVQKEG